MKRLLLIVSFVYFFLAPLTYHPDNKLVLYWAGLDHGKVWNIWDYGEEFNYPPLHFYLDKLQYFIAIPVGGEGFHEWLSTPNITDQDQPQLTRYTVAIKAGLILFALLAGYLLYLIVKQAKGSETQAKIVASLWFFNPIVIYSIPIMGQNDVMAITFFLAGWYFLARSKLAAVLAFGLGASIKMYPLIWLPFLLLTTARFSGKEKLTIFFSSIGIYIATLLPFIFNPIFQKYVLGSDINTRFFIAQVNLGFSEAIQVVPILLLLLFFFLFRKKPEDTTKVGIGYQALAVMTVSLVLLGFSHFHPQWFTWVIPFWAIWIMSLKREFLFSAAIVSFLTFIAWVVIIILFKNDSSLSYGLFLPINSSLANLPVLYDLLDRRGIDVDDYVNYAHSWLAGMGAIALAGLALNYQKLEANYFNNFSFPRLNLHKNVIFLISLISAAVLLYLVYFLSFVVPTPLSSQSPIITEYEPFASSSASTTFIADNNNLYRVDLFFQNPDLKNQDDFTFNLIGDQSRIIYQQPFSGYNIGFPSILRFDFPVQENSKDKSYTVELKQATMSGSTVNVGVTENNNIHSLAIKSYYKPQRGISYIAQRAFSQLVQSVSKLPFLYVSLLGILFIYIYTKSKNS